VNDKGCHGPIKDVQCEFEYEKEKCQKKRQKVIKFRMKTIRCKEQSGVDRGMKGVVIGRFSKGEMLCGGRRV
jgi:hypothetical protein